MLVGRHGALVNVRWNSWFMYLSPEERVSRLGPVLGNRARLQGQSGGHRKGRRESAGAGRAAGLTDPDTGGEGCGTDEWAKTARGSGSVD